MPEPANTFILISLPLYIPSASIGLVLVNEPENIYLPSIDVFDKFIKCSSNPLSSFAIASIESSL